MSQSLLLCSQSHKLPLRVVLRYFISKLQKQFPPLLSPKVFVSEKLKSDLCDTVCAHLSYSSSVWLLDTSLVLSRIPSIMSSIKFHFIDWLGFFAVLSNNSQPVSPVLTLALRLQLEKWSQEGYKCVLWHSVVLACLERGWGHFRPISWAEMVILKCVGVWDNVALNNQEMGSKRAVKLGAGVCHQPEPENPPRRSSLSGGFYHFQLLYNEDLVNMVHHNHAPPIWKIFSIVNFELFAMT